MKNGLLEWHEALLTLGHHPSPHTTFSPVKAPVQHRPPAGVILQAPFLLFAVPSSQAGPVSSPDTTHTATSVEMTSPLENLYPDNDTSEPVLAQPGLVSAVEQVSHPLPVSASDVSPEPFEEGEVSEPEDLSWSEKCQFCRKLENLNLVLIDRYPSNSSEPGGLHVDQFLHPPKSQSRWHGIHPAEPKDPTRPGKYVNTWANNTTKLNSAFPRICKPAFTVQPPSCPIFQDTLRKR